MTDFIDMNAENEQRPSRPGFLTVLGVLSFIAIGLNLIIIVFQLVSGKPSEEQMLEEQVVMASQINEMNDLGMGSLAGFLEQAQAMSNEINQKFYLAMGITLITYIIGLFGVLKMWKGAKVGFHLYIIYNLLGIGGLYLYVSPENVPSIGVILNAILSGLFIFLYSRNLHWMK
jgi:hypothetical protein